ncbi:hypothetical protein [Myxosarcina sp. GI1(2024)]
MLLDWIKSSLVSVQKVKRKSSVTKAYKYIEDLFTALHQFQILSYISEAENIYQSLPARTKRVGTQDCRITAIAHVDKFIVILINFHRFVLGLRQGAEGRGQKVYT